jgi:hypothetical protein
VGVNSSGHHSIPLQSLDKKSNCNVLIALLLLLIFDQVAVVVSQAVEVLFCFLDGWHYYLVGYTLSTLTRSGLKAYST